MKTSKCRSPAQSAAAATPHASCAGRGNTGRTPRSPCTTWSTKAAPPTRRSKPSHERVDRAAVRAIALGTLRWYLRLRPARRTARQPAIRRAVAAARGVARDRRAPGRVFARRRRSPGPPRRRREPRARRRTRQRRGQRGVAPIRRPARGVVSRVGRGPAQRHAHPRWLVDALSVRMGRSQRRDPRGQQRSIRRWSCASIPRSCMPKISCVPGARSDARRGRSSGIADAVVLERPVAVQTLPGFEVRRGVRAGWRSATRRAAARRAGRHARARCLRRARRQDPAHRAAHARARRAGRRRRRRVCASAACAKTWNAPGRDALADDGRPAQRCPPSLTPASFDRVLVDAPCSATGVIRRHPDIKLLRRASDIESASSPRRRKILATAFELLKAGGRLIYCTCSVIPAENEGVVAAFLRDRTARDSRLMAGKPQTAARIARSRRSAGSCCPAGARAPMASTMLASLKPRSIKQER